MPGQKLIKPYYPNTIMVVLLSDKFQNATYKSFEKQRFSICTVIYFVTDQSELKYQPGKMEKNIPASMFCHSQADYFASQVHKINKKNQ